MKPLRDLVVVTLDDKEEKTASGLFVVKAWKDAINTGTVKAVGDLVDTVKVGDHVRFNPYATHPGLEDGDRFVKESDILARG